MKKIIAILLALCMLAMLGMAPAEEGVAPPMGDPIWCYDEQSYSAYVEGALDGCDNLGELIVLCDPAILPDGLLDDCAAHATIYAAADASDEQLRILSEKANRPWCAPLSRLGEEAHELIEMPYAMQSIDDYWYDTEYARLDRYHGYELNLYLPREAEGTALTAIGGDMMGRARVGDNYEMELPVRSVVIPENYTENYSAFAGCETLETVICYAPLEETAGMFEGCTNLRHVVFVNGVRSLGRGVLYGCDKATGVMNGDPRELFEIILTINEDGSANLAYLTDEAWHWTQNMDGSLLMTKDSDGVEMPLNALDENFICFGSMDGDGNAFGGYLIFSRDEQAVWTPDMLAVAEPTGEAEASIDVSTELSERMEVRYVCKSAEAGGVTLDAALLGDEYALTFHANGTVDFVMVGNTIPGLKWTQGDGSLIIDYYGSTMEAVLTENGFDLDYFGTMLMHFE